MQEQIQGFQLSPQQKRLWSLQQDSNAYQAQCAILLEGNLKLDVLKSALQQVLNRHEILRTTFHRPRGIKIPIQVIADSNLIEIDDHNLGNCQELEQKIETLFQLGRQRISNWKGLSQITLVNVSPHLHVLLVSLPALCADTVGLKNLARELSSCYTACLQGDELSNTPVQYADIAQWQNQLLEADDPEAETEYWQQIDVSILGNLRLFSENRTEGTWEFAPQLLSRQIAPDLAAQIEAIARQFQTNVAAFLLSCWQILLWRLTEKSNLIIGTAADGRNYEELQASIGLLVKYLPLYCHLEDEYRFSDVLRQVEVSTDEIYELQESFSWEKFVAQNGNSLELSFFPFGFEFESLSDKYSAGDVSFSLYKQYTCVDRFKLKLACVQGENGLTVEFHYDANVFALEDMQRLAGEFETLLADCVAHPDAAISRLDILSQVERQQLLIEFNQNQSKISIPRHEPGNEPKSKIHQCIHHWFESQVEQTPDNIAVVFKNQLLTYRELNQLANQLAHHLLSLGVGSEVLVGICVERSHLMVVGLLGILKAGGAYVPIDPTYPSERKAFILGDSQTPVLLTQQHLVTDLPTDGTKVICLDVDWEVIAKEQIENPVSRTTAENLAYVIYTSGSTGKPKGTLIPHRGLVNYLSWCTQAYAVEQGAGTVVHSPLGFDLTITSLFSPLLMGNRVEILPEDQGIETLSNSLRHHSNLSLVKITPAHLELLSQQLSPKEAAGRTRALIIGGENLLAENIAFWQQFAPETMLVNEYGPTETVVGCCIYQVPTGQNLSGSIPIGRPIANTQLYVLDQYCQPVPIGVAGELHIGGLGVARGYLNRPELTAQKFIPNPFCDNPEERLYKTGDLVRYRPDGILEFLGRLDDQVKIRGFRIELGEIEAVVLEHPGVQEAVVQAREDVPGDKRLVAYIVLNQESPCSISDLRSFVQQKLPEYMVPTAFVPLKALPLTANGKVDRRALPIPDGDRPDLQEVYEAPRSEVERALANIWQEVLHLEKVGVNDNFFDLGGNSLLMVQVHHKLREVLQCDISIVEMFQNPTIKSLAKYINLSSRQTSAFESVNNRIQKQTEAVNRQKILMKRSRNLKN
jgi:amino acid adenylation domain-containing protein